MSIIFSTFSLVPFKQKHRILFKALAWRSYYRALTEGENVRVCAYSALVYIVDIPIGSMRTLICLRGDNAHSTHSVSVANFPQTSSRTGKNETEKNFYHYLSTAYRSINFQTIILIQRNKLIWMWVVSYRKCSR